MVKTSAAETMPWPSPFERGIEDIRARRGNPVCVLASGDPFFYAVGSVLAAVIPPEEIICVPAPSSLSIAAARLGWAIQDCEIVSLHGRPLERIIPHLRPGARLLVRSWDQTTPEKLCRLLVERCLGTSRFIVLEAWGGPNEVIRETRAGDFLPRATECLNLVAIETPATTSGPYIPLTSGLPDGWFESDGQITAKSVRSLSPHWPHGPGAWLWDIGAA